MTLLGISARNLRDHRLRGALTVLGVAVAVLTFLVLRTVIWSWTVAAEVAAQDRIATRHKVTFVMPLPLRYFEEVRRMPGVKAATFANWTDAKDPRHEHEFFAALAVHSPTFLEVYDEVAVEPEARRAWLEDRQGALVGEALAGKLGLEVGDRVRLRSGIYPDPGEWEFRIRGVYRATRKSVDRSMFLFHWDYLNQSIPDARRDQIGWMVARVSDAARAAEVSAAIDRHFDVRDVQTLTMSERAMQTSFIGMISAVLRAIDVMSVVILAIMTLILGNTIAMSVRDRTGQYAVMRAIGFSPRQVAIAVVGEGALLGALGGALGLGLSWPFVNQGMGRFVEENLGSFFPYFRVTPAAAATALALAVLLGTVASLVPARRAARLRVIDALRTVG